MKDLDKILKHVDDNFLSYLEGFREYMQQPGDSLSNDGKGIGIEESVQMSVRLFENLGAAKTEVMRFERGHPAIFSKILSKAPGARSIIFYGHYDVMPVDEDKWSVPPYEARILDPQVIGLNPKIGKVMVARGIQNQKGPFYAFLLGLRAMLEVTGDIPVSVLFCYEGEEELGSPNLPAFRDAYMEEFKQGHAYHFQRFGQEEDGRHRIYRGYKGWVNLELEVKGGDWGGPCRKSLLAEHVGWVDSPLVHLIHAMSTLMDKDGRVLVEGFYDNYRPPTPTEKAELEIIKSTLDEEAIMANLGIKRFKRGCSGKEKVEDYIMGPHINIDGIVGGYTGPGVKTNLPAAGVVKMDCRFGRDLTPQEVVEKITRHFKKCGLNEVELRFSSGYEWSRTPTKAEIIQAAVDATEALDKEYIIYPTRSSCSPQYLFNRAPLHLPGSISGLGHGGWEHTTDEYSTVEGIKDSIKYTVAFLNRYAELTRGKKLKKVNEMEY